MSSDGVGWRHAGTLAVTGLLLAACAGQHHLAEAIGGGSEGTNVYPPNYKAEILGAMHAYLNDPTGIRDASLSEPMLKTVASNTRYVVCLRFNAKQRGNSYAGVKEIAAVFVDGRFDQFAEPPAAREPCAGATYAPFPELGKLPR